MSNHEKDGLGLDKVARLALKREDDSVEQTEDTTLEPPFPYTILPFPLSFFET